MAQFAVCLPLLSLCFVSVAGAQTPAIPTLKANTKIVVIDVVVTDKQDNTVKGLKEADFALAENGAPQTISHFEAHTSLSAEDAEKLPPMPKLDANIFTNYSPAPANGPLTVLLFDSLNTHDKLAIPGKPAVMMMDQGKVDQQVLKYLAIPHPGVRMELFEQNGDLRLLHGFTSDPEVLKQALIDRKRMPKTSMLVPNGLCDEDNAGYDPSGLQARGMSACRDAEMRDVSLATLQGMAALARYMGGLPGRKNLLWFSTSFPIPAAKTEVSTLLQKTMALFAKNQVVVYPISAAGLLADTDGTPRKFLAKADAERATMEEMAEATGGKVYANTNDIAGAVEQAVDHGSNYYTLTYTPANRDWKGEFRKVEVKLAQKGYTLAYRPGYYAEDADRKGAKADAAPGTLHAAMEYGSPQPADIVFKVAVNPATGLPEKVVARANALAPRVYGPFQRYVLDVAALPTAFTFTRSAPGKIHMAARLVTCVYTADGAMVDSTILNIRGEIEDARYQTIMADGVKFRQEISVPVKGEHFLRIGIEDMATTRMGVVEIPVATVAKLKPLAGADGVKK